MTVSGRPILERAIGDETIFSGGRILTMDDGRPDVEALLSRDGRIVAVGGDDEVRAQAGPAAETVDLAGRVVIPGFVDGHTHLEMTTTHLSYALKVMAADYKSLAGICAALAER